MRLPFKNLFIFTSGIGIGTVLGGMVVTRKFLKNKEVALVLSRTISDTIIDYIYKDKEFEHNPPMKIFNPDEMLDTLIFDTKQEATEVLDGLHGIIDKYKTATVLDYWNLAGFRGNYIAVTYGWSNIHSAAVVRTGGRYIINLPEPRKLEREDGKE